MKTVLRRSLKGLGYLLGFFVLLALAFYAWLVIANWSDAPLSEDAKRALQYTPPTEEQLQDNGFLIISGLDAPFAADDKNAVPPAMALGRQRLTREIERHAWVQANPNTTEGMPPTIDGAKGESEILPTALRCPPGEGDCFSWYQQKRASFEAQITHYQPLLPRANAAAQAKQFNNPLPFYLYADLPRYTWLMRTQELNLALATLQWLDGQPEKAAATITQTSVLRQLLAESSNNLVTSMIALAMHYQELRWLSNAAVRIDHQTPTAVALQIDQLLAMPLLSLHAGLEGEKRLVASIYYTLRDSRNSDIFSSPWEQSPARWQQVLNRIIAAGFLPNETTNQIVQDMAAVQRISDLPAHEQESAFSKYMSSKPDDAACRYPMLPLRNQMGRCLSAIGTAHYLAFMQRVNDIEGYRRLVLLQRQALVEGISPAAMPAWLDQSPVGLRNPYTRQAMEWDAGTSSLVFEGKEKQNQNSNGSSTYRVRLFTPAI